jgi:Fic family protein
VTSADEHSIDGWAFREALLEQRAMRLKGGLYHLTQIAMAYNSNRIEGSQLSAEQTRYVYETQTITGDARVDDVVETANHFRMFDRMVDSVGQPLTARDIRHYHAILKTGTTDADKPWFAVGDWKKRPNVVGGQETTPPALVAAQIDGLLSAYPGEMTFNDICDFHHRFESIHPFQDGNGRVGRLIMFGQCLANGIMPFIVLDQDKAYYYRGLGEYDDDPTYLRDTFRHFQDRYKDAFGKFVADPGASQG